MLLFRDNGILYAECKMDLKFPIDLNGKLYKRSDDVSYQEIDVVYNLLKLNANVLVNINGEFKKPDLYWLGNVLLEKDYEISEGLPIDNIEDETVSEAAEFNPAPTEDEDVAEESEDEKDNRNENHGKNRKKRNNNNNNQEGDK